MNKRSVTKQIHVLIPDIIYTNSVFVHTFTSQKCSSASTAMGKATYNHDELLSNGQRSQYFGWEKPPNTFRESQKLNTVLKVTFSSNEIMENLGQPEYFLQ